MTKGGTGDVLAGLVAALYCKNDAFTSVVAASYINKKAGEDLYSKKGFWFNASDLADQIPETMKKLVL
jgi:NAD(P)H-hydrate epimerase